MTVCGLDSSASAERAARAELLLTSGYYETRLYSESRESLHLSALSSTPFLFYCYLCSYSTAAHYTPIARDALPCHLRGLEGLHLRPPIAQAKASGPCALT
jgi:hypothetical protein